MLAPKGNDEQRQALLNLDSALMNKPGTTVEEQNRKEREKKDLMQETIIEKERKNQGLTIDSSVNASMALHLSTKTNDPLVIALQADNRYLLNNILNNIELIKKEIKDINRGNREIKDSIEQFDMDDGGSFCCLWPFYQTHSL